MIRNPQIDALFSGLAAANVQHRYNWQAKRSPDIKGYDVAHLSFIGDGFAPGEATAVLISYGTEGYGLYFDSAVGSISADVARIAKPRAHTRPDVVLAALAPFAEAAKVIPEHLPDNALLFAHFPSLFGAPTEIRVGDFRAAAEAAAAASATALVEVRGVSPVAGGDQHKADKLLRDMAADPMIRATEKGAR